MDFTRITSKDNAIIKSILQLQKSSSKRKDEGVFILEGLRLCLDAIQNGYSVNTVIVSDSALNKYSEKVKELYENSNEKYLPLKMKKSPTRMWAMF